MERHELAWAAGFFDGEGWANRTGRGVQARINQADPDGVPAVLVKFLRIVGVGRVKGPQIRERRQPLYYWHATSRSDIARLAQLIGPFLCRVTHAELSRTLATRLPDPLWPAATHEELAWAGGFFDGEGCTYLEKHRTHPDFFVPRLYVPQTSDTGIAPELLRLRSALADLGTISGVRRDKGHGRPYRRWRVFTESDVQLGLHLLWPFIGEIKRSQAQGVMRVVHSQPALPRGNPAFGVAGARYCLRGHDKWNARVRAYRSRGRSQVNDHLSQCLTCMREQARARRRDPRSEKLS